MKNKRQSEILSLISEYEVKNQEMLIDLLRKRGYSVTQATISRDINELNLEKTMLPSGVTCYMRAQKANSIHFKSIFSQSVTNIDYAGNIVCVKCYAGLANAACATLDLMNIDCIVGTISGDDTFFVLVRTENDAKLLTERLKSMI